MNKSRLIQSVFFLLCMMAVQVHAQDMKAYSVGDQVEQGFELKDVSGEQVALADFADQKGVILIFSCNHCPYVVAYEDRMIELHQNYAEVGYPVVAINPNDKDRQPEDDFPNMQKRAKEKNFPFHYLYDADQSVARQFGATRTPHVFLLKNNEDGNFVVSYIGAIDDSTEPDEVEKTYVEDAIRALESSRRPMPSYTKAVGCTIKWKE